MKTFTKRVWRLAFTLSVLAVLVFGGSWALRLYQLYGMATDLRSQLRYLVETGGTVGEAPAADTLSSGYLQNIFGDNEGLFGKLQDIISSGMANDKSLSLGKVAAMVITYHKTPEGQVVDVAAHVFGDFNPEERELGLHRDGYFQGHLDNRLWDMGNSAVGIFGRDMVMFTEEKYSTEQQTMVEQLVNGRITLLTNSISRTLYFALVLPNPIDIVPQQLKRHVQSVIVKGSLTRTNGLVEVVALTPSSRSANYALTVSQDIKTLLEAALLNRFGAYVEQTPWGQVVACWWAMELLKLSQESKLEKEGNLFRALLKLDRIKVNLAVKCAERASRDVANLRLTETLGLDAREVDQRLQTSKTGHYWTDDHQWGPDWPFGPDTTVTNQIIPDTPTNTAPTAAANG